MSTTEERPGSVFLADAPVKAHHGTLTLSGREGDPDLSLDIVTLELTGRRFVNGDEGDKVLHVEATEEVHLSLPAARELLGEVIDALVHGVVVMKLNELGVDYTEDDL